MILEDIMEAKGFSFFGKNTGIKDKTKDFAGIFSDMPCQAAAPFRVVFLLF